MIVHCSSNVNVYIYIYIYIYILFYVVWSVHTSQNILIFSFLFFFFLSPPFSFLPVAPLSSLFTSPLFVSSLKPCWPHRSPPPLYLSLLLLFKATMDGPTMARPVALSSNQSLVWPWIALFSNSGLVGLCWFYGFMVWFVFMGLVWSDFCWYGIMGLT